MAANDLPKQQIDFSKYIFHPVIKLPSNYTVRDLSGRYDPSTGLVNEYSIGKYDEERPYVYTQELFRGEEIRNIHMGIDIGCPVGTPVYAFYDGEIYMFGNNNREGDYGYTIITKHSLDGIDLYALHGHLSEDSLKGKKSGQLISKGEVIAYVGDRHENGGWNPHLHFQLSYLKPDKPDLPGVVSKSMRNWARAVFPDPRLVLGKIY